MKRKSIGIGIVVTTVFLINFALVNRSKKSEPTTTYDKKYENVDEILELYKGNLIVKKDGKYGIKNIDGDIKKKFDYSGVKRLTDNIYVLYKDGDIVTYNLEINKELEVEDIIELKDGLFKVLINNRWGVMDEKLNLVVENINDEISENDKFYLLKRDKENYLLFKDIKQEKKLQKYEDIEIEKNGYIYVKQKDFWGMIDENEEIIIPNEYKELKSMNEEIFMGIDKDNRFTLINLKKNIIKILDIENHSRYADGYIMVLKDGKIGYIDEEGEEVIKTLYDAGFLPKKDKKFIQLKKEEGQWILFDRESKDRRYIDYDDIGELENNYMVVEKNLQFGYIDITGKEIIPLDYLSAENFIESLAVVGKDSGLGVIDNKGKTILNFLHDKVVIDDNFIFVEKDNKYGAFNKMGKEIIPLVFDKLTPVDRHNIIFKENEKVGILRLNGER